MLLLSPPLAIMLARFFSGKKIAIAIAVLTIVVYLSLVGFLLPRLDDGALKDLALVLATEIDKQDQEVGFASKEFNLKKFGMYLNNLVFTVDELSGDDLAQYKQRRQEKVIPFLKSKERVFCLITKSDYNRFVPKRLQDRLFILEESMVWKNLDFKGYVSIALNKNWGRLKEEAYLISNRRQ